MRSSSRLVYEQEYSILAVVATSLYAAASRGVGQIVTRQCFLLVRLFRLFPKESWIRTRVVHGRSRHILELWLDGESLGDIAETSGAPERDVAVIRGSSIWRLRELIAPESCPEEAKLQQKKRK